MMVNQFPQIGYKYEYNPKYKIHYIAVYPDCDEVITEEYCKEELCIHDFLEQKYPEETFLFGSENTNFTPLKNPEIFDKIKKDSSFLFLAKNKKKKEYVNG
jgi:hypothetical protein